MSESTELEVYGGPSNELLNRRDLRNRDTDSWTDVLAEVGDLATRIADTDFVPASFKGSVPAVAATILQGREVGFGPMTALGSLHSIKGKVGLYAEAMRALVFQAGHEIAIPESTSAVCTMKGRRRGSTEWTSVTWTIADARQAGLLNANRNWETYPRPMLQARATSELCRLIFPDVIRGLASVEELETLDSSPATGGGAASSGGEKRPVKRAAKKAAKKAERAEAPAPPLPDDDASTDGAGSDEGKSDAGKAPADATDPAPPPLPGDASPAAAEEDPATPSAGSGGGSDTRESEPPPQTSDDDAPEDDAVEVDEDDPEPRLSNDQRTRIVATFNGLGVQDRTERLYTSSVIVGRELSSANDMTTREASSLIDTLAMCKSREDLENVIQATEAHHSDGES